MNTLRNWLSVSLLLAATQGFAATVWQTGQVIGISEMRADPSTFFLEAATGSRIGHVGIVEVEGKVTYVNEANPPVVSRVLMNEFLKRASLDPAGKPEYALVEPATALSASQTLALVTSMKKMRDDQIPYNFTQVITPGALNCSEFVAQAFQAAGLSGVGQVEKLSDMNLQSLGGALIQIWGELPPLESPVITPISILASPVMKLTHSNLVINRTLSDQEIYTAWNKGGAIAYVAELSGTPVQKLEQLGAAASAQPYRSFPSGWRP